MHISIVIPIFNEEENLYILHKQLSLIFREYKNDYEIIYINDGSKDNSLNALNKIRKEDSRVKIMDFKKNRGQTAALFEGLRKAKGDYILTIDADLAYNPKDLTTILTELLNADVATGVRSNRLEADGVLKFISSKVANCVRNRLFKENFKDVGCQLRGYKKKCIERFSFYKESHLFILSILRAQGFTIKEIEVKTCSRKYGSSKYGVWNRIFKELGALIKVKKCISKGRVCFPLFF